MLVNRLLQSGRSYAARLLRTLESLIYRAELQFEQRKWSSEYKRRLTKREAEASGRQSQRHSVLVLIPFKPNLNSKLKRTMHKLAARLFEFNPDLDLTLVFDDTAIPSLPSDLRPWSKVTRIRNKMLRSIDLSRFEYVCWIDADLVYYPPDFITRLIEVNPSGITAPMVLIEDSRRFYDIAAFVLKGRSHIAPIDRRFWMYKDRQVSDRSPYVDCDSDLVPMDCVGTVYVCPTDVYLAGVLHEDHPAFTDHFPVCQKAIEMGKQVAMYRKVVTYHANLPKYGEAFH